MISCHFVVRHLQDGIGEGIVALYTKDGRTERGRRENEEE